MKGVNFKLWIALWTGLWCFAAGCANASPSLTLGVVSGQPGDTVNIPVNFDNNDSVTALQFDVQYDTTQLSAGNAIAGSILAPTGHGVASSHIAPDTLRVVVHPPLDNAVIDSGTAVELPFTLNSAIGGSQLPTPVSVVMGDAEALPVVADQLNHGLIAVVGDTGSDTDLDGMPDAWEIGYGLDPMNHLDAAADLDGDGVTNLNEFLAGTNPLDDGSLMTVIPVESTPGSGIFDKIIVIPFIN